MKLMLLGSIPSAIHATFTPAPVSPSERAVGWLGLSESVLVEVRPSGSSCGAPLLQAPGITFGLTVDDDVCAFLDAPSLTGSTSGVASRMVASGITLATS